MKTTAPRCLALLVVLAIVPAATAGPHPTGRAQMDRRVAEAHDADRPARVIIKYRAGASAGLRQRLRSRGLTPDRHHRRVGAYSVALGAGELRRLASDPDVIGISTDAEISSHGQDGWFWDTLTAGADAQALRRTLGLPAIAKGGGDGVGVAVIDSGIAPVPDLAGQITAFYDFTARGVATDPTDAYGHGTHVAGLIAGSGVLSLGAYAGIAPQVRLIGMKVLDGNGQGYASHALNAIEFAIENRTALGIDVINLSLGHPVLEPPADDPLVQAVERASAAGIVVVTSAGNFGKNSNGGGTGYGGIASPGNAPSAVTVGALRTLDTADRRDDRVAPYSSRGPTWYDGQVKPDLLAPGHGLIAAAGPLSTLYQKKPAHGPVGGYIALSGTSMAAAVTTGVVALMIEANRLESEEPLTPNTVKLALQYTALAVSRPDSAAPKQLEQGAGGLNAAAAIEVARAIDPGTPVGDYWLAHGVAPATTIDGAVEPWSQQVIWGDRMVWGEAINRRQPAWTSAINWGTAATWSGDLGVDAASLVIDSFDLWSSQIVWGAGLVGATSDDEHIVWGNSAEDEHIVWGNSVGDEHIVWGNSTDDTSPPKPARRKRGNASAAKGRQ
ncbi:MAG: S8 family peptidase [Vicinamibacterales bacterium]